jgi:hypothetical protein
VLHATGTVECEAAQLMLDRLPPLDRRRTLGADRATTASVRCGCTRAQHDAARGAEHVPAVAARSTLRTTLHAGYAVSQRKRKLVEQAFGWGKMFGLLHKLRHRGLQTVR